MLCKEPFSLARKSSNKAPYIKMSSLSLLALKSKSEPFANLSL